MIDFVFRNAFATDFAVHWSLSEEKAPASEVFLITPDCDE
jgi:hypothetical protein